LAYFREIHVLDGPEKDFFDSPPLDNPEQFSKVRAKLLKAHYSHLQEPGVGLFLEIGERVHPRLVELIDARETEIPSAPIPGVLDEPPLGGRHQAASRATLQHRNLAVILAGGRRLQMYYGGRCVLEWPDRDTGNWWRPDKKSQWTTPEPLRKLLTCAKGKVSDTELTSAHIAHIADALLFISETPGLGCILVVVPDENHISPHLTSLNPRAFRWICPLRLVGASRRTIQNMLMQDGATILNIKKAHLTGQQQLVAFSNNRALDARKAIRANPERLTYGTRHVSASDITSVLSERCIAITVSADGPISVFARGKRVAAEANPEDVVATW
jgi:DNA integrity scanning protein DisA with diadenylate cyclase activity